MAHECEKEREFGEITTTIRYFQEAEKRREERDAEKRREEIEADRRREARDERIAVAMEQVAAQGATIASHSETLSRHESAFSEVFPRLRKIETSCARVDGAKFIAWIFSGKRGPYVLAVLAVGFFFGVSRVDAETLGKIIKYIIK